MDFWDDPLQEIWDFLNDIIEEVYITIDTVYDFGIYQLQKAEDTLQAGIDYAYDLGQQALREIDNLTESVTEWINNAISDIQDSYEWVVGEATKFFTTGLNTLNQEITDLGTRADNLLDTINTQVTNIIDTYITPLQTSLTTLATQFTDLNTIIRDPNLLFELLEDTITVLW